MELKKPIAIIPARGGSKRVENKNIAEINGRPLIHYAIDVCLKSKLFSDIYVNTNDSKIYDISKKYGAQPYLRPEKYATDTAYIIDAIKEMIETLGLHEKSIGILLPTCPLRTANDLINAWNLYRKNKSCVISVCKYETPVQLAHFINKDNNKLEPFFPSDYKKTTRSYGHQQSYRFNGGIVFNNAEQLLKQSNLIGVNPVPYIMPEERSIDIDHPYQLEWAHMIIKKKV